MIDAQSLLPMAAVALVVLTFLFARTQAGSASSVRVRQLEEAAALLDAHAAAMARVLDSSLPPEALKRTMISLSHALEDRASVLRVAQHLASQPMEFVSEVTFNGLATADEMARLRAHSDIMDDCATAVTALVVGAMLRWPESAELLEPVTARMAMRPKLDFGLAAAISNLGRGNPFGAATQAPAMA